MSTKELWFLERTLKLWARETAKMGEQPPQLEKSKNFIRIAAYLNLSKLLDN